MAQLHRMTDHLDEIEPVETTNIAPALGEFASRLGRREIVFVFSDFLGDPDELESPLQRLRYSRHDVVLFHVMHHHEWEFEFEGMVKFLGLEVEDEYTTQTEDIRRGYLEAVREHTRKLDEVCQRNRVECVPVDTSRPLAEVLIDYLNHRSRQNRGR